MNPITYKGPNHWTPPKPTQWQQERKRGPILPMATEHKPALLAIFDRMIDGMTGYE